MRSCDTKPCLRPAYTPSLTTSGVRYPPAAPPGDPTTPAALPHAPRRTPPLGDYYPGGSPTRPRTPSLQYTIVSKLCSHIGHADALRLQRAQPAPGTVLLHLVTVALGDRGGLWPPHVLRPHHRMAENTLRTALPSSLRGAIFTTAVGARHHHGAGADSWGTPWR